MKIKRIEKSQNIKTKHIYSTSNAILTGKAIACLITKLPNYVKKVLFVSTKSCVIRP